MTTHTHLTGTKGAVSTPTSKKPLIWLWILAALFLVSMIGTGFLVFKPNGDETIQNRRALESISARYQGRADLRASGKEAGAQQALEILSLRYQGMADLYAKGINTDTNRALRILSSRYQGMAELYTIGDKEEAYQSLAIISARYQALADMYQSSE